MIAEGPLLPTSRIEITDRDFYAEMRNVRWPNKIGYEIEHGSISTGHRGTWGRDGISEAMDCFAAVIRYAHIGRE